MALIAAIATPRGQGGIAIARISGPGARDLLAKVFRASSPAFKDFTPWKMHHGYVLDQRGEALDDVLAVFMPGPNTYTGEDVAEIHCHGSDVIAREILASLLRSGARQAERGEFTRRAFVNGRIDLSQAEAVAEMIAAPSREALRYGLNRLSGLLGRKIASIKAKIDDLRALACVGLDFPDDEIEGLNAQGFGERVRDILTELDSLQKGRARAAAMQEGFLVVLAGRVNAGKSSLLNALVGSERALVTDIPGTTRDFLEMKVDLDGLPVCLVDTAGLRASEDMDMVEEMGIARSRELLDKADAILLVQDGALMENVANLPASAPEWEIMARAGEKPTLAVWNKCDICKSAETPSWAGEVMRVSAKTGENVDALAEKLREILLGGEKAHAPEHGLAPNARQAAAIDEARGELRNLLLDMEENLTYDCWTGRLDCASAALNELLGLAPHAELLDKIFSRFCIGK